MAYEDDYRASDELLARAKSRAALEGISLKKFFIAAVEQKLTPPQVKKRRLNFPLIHTSGPIVSPTPEQLEEAAIPIQHYVDEFLRRRR